MSREAFVQSEDKEFEVTFREVRNWDEYADLDFEADTAPLTEEEAGTSDDETVAEEEFEAPENETPVAEESETSGDDSPEDIEEEPVLEDESEDTAAHDITEEDAEEVGSDSEEEAEEVDSDEDNVNEVTSGTSQEAILTLPIEENFDMGPAWEEDEDEEAEEDVEELPLGEPASDTESFGASLESIYHDENSQILLGDVSDAETVNPDEVSEEAEKETETPVIYFDPMNDNPAEVFPEATQYDLSSAEAVELDPFAFTKDNHQEVESHEESDDEGIDTFEAITTEGESLNKAEVVEELEPEYSEDTLPETIPLESGEYFSFDDVSLDSNESEPVKVEEEAKEDESPAEDSEDEEMSLELDYSDEDDK